MRSAACLLTLSALWAHDAPTTKLTWTREISRLITLRCAGCHQPGGAAPFSLRTYAEARPWAVAIKEEVLLRRMPPWPAAKGFGDFSNDISLPQEEINRLAEWAEGGSPEGDAQYFRPLAAVPLWWSAPPPPGRRFLLEGRLAQGVTIRAVRRAKSEETPGKAWAESPGGVMIPLVWFTGVGNRQWLIYRNAVNLPAGSVIHGVALEAAGS